MTFAIYSRPLSSEDKPQKVAEFATYDEALNDATERHVKELWELYDRKADNQALFDLWRSKGTDITIEPDNEPIKFSVWDAGPLFIVDITQDMSRPLHFEVTCTDALSFASGGMSPPKNWTFFVKAFASYANPKSYPLIERAVGLIYNDMSATASEADGSSYILLKCDIKPIEKEEFTRGIGPDRTIYAVQENGTLMKEPHFMSV